MAACRTRYARQEIGRSTLTTNSMGRALTGQNGTKRLFVESAWGTQTTTLHLSLCLAVRYIFMATGITARAAIEPRYLARHWIQSSPTDPGILRPACRKTLRGGLTAHFGPLAVMATVSDRCQLDLKAILTNFTAALAVVRLTCIG